MPISEQALDFLLGWEGEVLTVYRDSRGLPTIGRGHLLTPEEIQTGTIKIAGQNVSYRRGITKEQSKALERQDLARFEAIVRKRFADRLLKQHEFDALVIVAFNIGESAFSSATFVARLVNKDYAGAKTAWGWFNKETRWDKRTRTWRKVLSDGLVKRRAAEIKLFFDADYSSRP